MINVTNVHAQHCHCLLHILHINYHQIHYSHLFILDSKLWHALWVALRLWICWRLYTVVGICIHIIVACFPIETFLRYHYCLRRHNWCSFLSMPSVSSLAHPLCYKPENPPIHSLHCHSGSLSRCFIIFHLQVQG